MKLGLHTVLDLYKREDSNPENKINLKLIDIIVNK
jgi:hypothetical protein